MITNEFSDQLHAEKYRIPGETFREAMSRIAGAMTSTPEDFADFREELLTMQFLPAGRIQAAMGAPKSVTPYNCFVSGTVHDSFESIMARATEAAQTMRMGGGIGYDFSRLRPRGARIKTLDSKSTGPVSFMTIYDAICQCIASSGHRRGAQMGVLRVDHPDIVEFVTAKHNQTKLQGFNLSVGITDEFMRAVEKGEKFVLRHAGEAYSEVDAHALWELIMRSTWDWAEPGVLFIDQINRMNNLWYCETIEATNPCGEQPLQPYGACLLGSFNLVKFLDYSRPQHLDLIKLRNSVRIAVRAMDSIIDNATYPLIEQESQAKQKRRMGLGVTGVANAIETIGCHYGSSEFCRVLEKVLITIRDEAYRTSINLAREKGAFPGFTEKYLNGSFVKNLPDDIRLGIQAHGIRNSHLLSIAPTGTISLCADNVSSGIEPVFAYEAARTIRTDDGDRTVIVEDYGAKHLGTWGKLSSDVTSDEHLAVLATAQKYVDSSVSKTCNVSPNMPWSNFKDIYMRAWRMGAKGCTTFNTGGKRGAILCTIDPVTGAKDCGE